MQYIYENPNWPNFKWDEEKITPLLSRVKAAQSVLLDKMTASDFKTHYKALVGVLSDKIIKANEIQGKISDPEKIRSAVAKRLCVDLGGKSSKERDVEGVIKMTIDATQNFDQKMSKERLFKWHEVLFPTGFSRDKKITVGAYRLDAKASMKIVSGSQDDRKIHYEAPAAQALETEVNKLVDYINQKDEVDYLIKAGVVHLWFVALHPFSDGNGRIARALTDMMLTKSDRLKYRFYTVSSQIAKRIDSYRIVMEETLNGGMDITNWILWFLENLLVAIEGGEENQKHKFSKLMS